MMIYHSNRSPWVWRRRFAAAIGPFVGKVSVSIAALGVAALAGGLFAGGAALVALFGFANAACLMIAACEIAEEEGAEAYRTGVAVGHVRFVRPMPRGKRDLLPVDEFGSR